MPTAAGFFCPFPAQIYSNIFWVYQLTLFSTSREVYKARQPISNAHGIRRAYLFCRHDYPPEKLVITKILKEMECRNPKRKLP